MALNIRLDENETALWNEVGSRGDHFRAATRDRASEQTRLTNQMSEIISSAGEMLDSVKVTDSVPEAREEKAPPLAPNAQVVHLRDEVPPKSTGRQD